MSSAIVLVQRKAVHLACDAAEYDGETGILDAVNVTKCLPMPTLHAAISMTGPGENVSIFASRLPEVCNSFDDLVTRAEEVIPRLFVETAYHYRSGKASGKLWLTGWSQGAARPAAYCMALWTDGYNRANIDPERRFRLKQYTLSLEPGVADLGEKSFFLPEDNDELVPEIDLLHLMEVQRHTPYRNGQYWVGGKCLLTSIDAKGISQRVLHHWEEDLVGELITPPSIDWKAWRAERERAHASSDFPPGVTRLKREMLDKKARKAARRAA